MSFEENKIKVSFLKQVAHLRRIDVLEFSFLLKCFNLCLLGHSSLEFSHMQGLGGLPVRQVPRKNIKVHFAYDVRGMQPVKYGIYSSAFSAVLEITSLTHSPKMYRRTL